jgi:hypothetical protein
MTFLALDERLVMRHFKWRLSIAPEPPEVRITNEDLNDFEWLRIVAAERDGA